MEVFPGNGDGTFQAPVSTPFGSKGGATVAAADFNRDGKLDVAVLSSVNVNGDQGIFILTGATWCL